MEVTNCSNSPSLLKCCTIILIVFIIIHINGGEFLTIAKIAEQFLVRLRIVAEIAAQIAKATDPKSV